MGRHKVLQRIEETFRETLAGQGPRAVLVLGETSTGKTRLAQEWLQKLEDRASCWIARGNPISAGSPFGLLGQLLRSGLGLREGDPLDLQRCTLHEQMRLLVGEEQADRIAELLGVLLGIPFPESVQLQAAREDAVLMGDQMLQAFLDWLRAETSCRPEEPHTTGELRELVERSGGHPFFLEELLRARAKGVV
ncbi:MAG: AAA family ATPase [Myxococcales bacterium]|nr:ATP-binding protein [Polyangiaceae bacterium]MDW8250347.1 AAA family ATPase [Myxococcales bacterium]